MYADDRGNHDQKKQAKEHVLAGDSASSSPAAAFQDGLEGTCRKPLLQGARNFENSLAALERQNDVTSIVNGMLKFSDDEAVQEQAARALFNLADDDENRGKIGAQVANAHEHICALPEENVAIGNRKHTHTHTHSHTQGGIEALVAAMGRHAESPGVQAGEARTLGNLANNNPENQRKIGAQVANANEYICALPEKNVAIGNRKHTHTHTHSHTQGGIEALVMAMGRHAESPDVQEAAAGALGYLAANHPENQRKIGAQVANAHEHICALPEENVAIGNRKHTRMHAGGHWGRGRSNGTPHREREVAREGMPDPDWLCPRPSREPGQDWRAGREYT
jgi:hypothetical protein